MNAAAQPRRKTDPSKKGIRLNLAWGLGCCGQPGVGITCPSWQGCHAMLSAGQPQVLAACGLM